MRILPDNLSLTETLRKDSGCTGLAPSFCELLQGFYFGKKGKLFDVEYWSRIFLWYSLRTNLSHSGPRGRHMTKAGPATVPHASLITGTDLRNGNEVMQIIEPASRIFQTEAGRTCFPWWLWSSWDMCSELPIAMSLPCEEAILLEVSNCPHQKKKKRIEVRGLGL